MAQDIGEEGGNIMKKKMIDQNMPVGKLKKVNDFLPPPNALVMPEETVKVTISLKKASVVFFKTEASKHHTKYQKMIRELLDRYATRYSTA